MPESHEYEDQGDLFRFGMTQCAHCGDLLHQDEASKQMFYVDGYPAVEHFCADKVKIEESCRIKWYLARLNTLGM